MCLIFVAYQCHSSYPLIVAANRDEFYHRPALPAAFWPDRPNGHPGILAGIDQQAGGTWLGITTTGRLAALTNYRDPRLINPAAPSRGALVRDFLMQDLAPEDYLKAIRKSGRAYNPFNLLVGALTADSGSALYYYSSIQQDIVPVPAGIHGLSNHFLNTPWPKVEKGKQKLEKLIRDDCELDREAFFEMMKDETVAPDEQLPDTGIGLEWERCLSPMFIRTDGYGTRNTTMMMVGADQVVWFGERRFEPDADGRFQAQTEVFEFQIKSVTCG